MGAGLAQSGSFFGGFPAAPGWESKSTQETRSWGSLHERNLKSHLPSRDPWRTWEVIEKNRFYDLKVLGCPQGPPCSCLVHSPSLNPDKGVCGVLSQWSEDRAGWDEVRCLLDPLRLSRSYPSLLQNPCCVASKAPPAHVAPNWSHLGCFQFK